MPGALNSSSRCSSASVSVSLRLDVGSSRISSLTFFRQRLGDLHQLLLAEAEIGDARLGDPSGPPWREARAVRGKVSCQSMTPRVAALVAEEDVLGDRQQRDQRQLLVDDDDAALFAVGQMPEKRDPRP